MKGALSAAGPPQGANAPLGGSDPAQRRSVGAMLSPWWATA